MRKFYYLSLLFTLSACFSNSNKKTANETNDKSYDSHVHIMSPGLIAYWKDLGIPFSKAESNYSNIDTILKKNNADFMDLIGMGYVYGNPEYYQGDDREEKLKEENDYLFAEASKHKNKVKPFFTIDPLKDYAVEEIERCYKINSKSGLKLHFSTSQVYLLEPDHLQKVKMIFEKAAELELNILLHFDNWHPKFGKPDLEIFADSILNETPKLVIRIAHFGTSGGFNEKTKNFIDAYLSLKEENRIPNRHKILFDISAVALDKDSEGVSQLTQEEFVELRNYVDKIGMENIIYGTDYPLYSSEDYVQVLKSKLNFSDSELRTIMKRKK